MLPEKDETLQKSIQKLAAYGFRVYQPQSKDKGFIKLYTDNILEILPKISPTALKVFMAMVVKINWNDNTIDMKKTEIMKTVAKQAKTITTALNELEKLGMIERIGSSVQRKYKLSEKYIKRGK